MLKFLFGFLLLANALLYGLHAGAFDDFVGSGREPVRLERQLNPERIMLGAPVPGDPENPVSPPAPESGAASPSAPGLVAAPVSDAGAARPAQVTACTEIGNFNDAEAQRFQARLERLEGIPAGQIGARLTRREVRDGINHMVMIPPENGKEGADRRLTDLRAKGVTDFFVIQDTSPRRWGISLGMFKTVEAANTMQAMLARKGVAGVRVIQYNAGVLKTAFQLRDADAQTLTGLERMMAGFPGQDVRGCAG
jgi:hypothetical protein